jgi:DNA-binding NarL/FixJ family response regulator
LLGVLAGDGYLHLDNKTGWLKLTAADQEFVQAFHEALEIVVPAVQPTVSQEARPHETEDPRTGRLRKTWVWDAQAISIELATAVSKRYGNLGTRTWRLSSMIERFGTPSLLGSWLAGLFDSDGNVTNRPLLRITGTNRPALEEVRTLAREVLGIEGTVNINTRYEIRGEHRLCYSFQLSRIEDVTRFALRCGSRHGHRRASLEDILGFPIRDPLSGQVDNPPLPVFLVERLSNGQPLTRAELRTLCEEHQVPETRLAALASAHEGFRSRASWTSDEDEVLRRGVEEGHSSEAIGVRLGRSVSSIESRASELGLRRRADLTAMCIDDALRAAAPRGGTWEDIAKDVAAATSQLVTAGQCRSRARRIGLVKPNAKQVTDHDRDEVLRLHGLGHTVQEIADAMGVAYLRARHIHDQLRESERIPTKSRAGVALVATRARGQEPVSAEQIKEILTLKSQGVNPSAAARILGRPRSTIAYHYNKEQADR